MKRQATILCVLLLLTTVGCGFGGQVGPQQPTPTAATADICGMSTKDVAETYDNHEIAFSALKGLAETGDKCAQYHVAFMYTHGRGVPQWYSKAVEWRRKAADQGHADAQFSLAEHYQFGIGVPQNDRKAAKWYGKAAEAGHEYALYRLAVFYREGKGVTKNADEAVRLLLEAAKKGFAFAQNDLGVMYAEKERYDKAAKWYSDAADQGDPTAQHNLAYCYLNGRGVSQDTDKAEALFKKSADQGFGPAQNTLGRLYETGELGPADLNKAMELFGTAANAGQAIAQFNSGRLRAKGGDHVSAAKLFRKAAAQGHQGAHEALLDAFDQGKAEPLDDAEAAEWHLRNAHKDDHEAQMKLAIQYEEGRGLERNLENAIRWYTESAKSGNARAQYKLARIYSAGTWVDRDEPKAVNWFTKSADQGNPDAQYELALRYASGSGVPEDDTRAVDLYSQSAEQDNPYAQYELANHYARGDGVAEDQSEAQRYYLLAAGNGSVLAMEELGNRYFDGTDIPRDYVAAADYFERYIEESERRDELQSEFIPISVRLGRMHEEGLGVSESDEMAVLFFLKAAVAHNRDGQFHLGRMYLELGRMYLEDEHKVYSGRILKDPSRIITEWCESRTEPAQEALCIARRWFPITRSWCELRTKPAQKALCIARSWFLRAANQGHTKAQAKLAQMFENGHGGVASLVQAHKWYNLAGDSVGRNRVGTKLQTEPQRLEEAQRLAGTWTPATVPGNTGSSNERAGGATGFWVSENHVLSNYHVVANCDKGVNVRGAGSAELVDADEDADLALLSIRAQTQPPTKIATEDADLALLSIRAQTQPPTKIATFPEKWEGAVKLGDEVWVAGFPLYSLGDVVVTRGHVTALLEEDDTLIQMNAEVYSGNSGGPVLDNAGNVVAVVVSGLDEGAYIGAGLPLPQLVNYAVSPDALEKFLSHHTYQPSDSTKRITNIAEHAKGLIVRVECVKETYIQP